MKPLRKTKPLGHGNTAHCAAVLLEVVLALALFVAAASVISTGLNAAVNRTERLRLQTHAENLTTSAVAELEVGLRAMVNTGAEPCDPPFADWTLQVQVTPFSLGSGEVSGLSLVTVKAKHVSSGTAAELSQIMAEPTGMAGDLEGGLEL